MEVYFAPSFIRVTKKLDPHIKTCIKHTINDIINFYESGEKTKGLGIKHLRNSLWEARSDIQMRIVYNLYENQLTFVLTGSHDEVKNLLKR